MKIKPLKFIILLPALSFLITACSVKNSTFIALKPSLKTGSLVYIYRPSSMSNAMVSPDLIIDGKKSFSISNNSYAYQYLPAGKHTFKLDLSSRFIGKTEYNLEVLAEQTYFLKTSTSLKFEKNKPYTRRFDLMLVPSNIALSEISEIPFIGDKETEKTQKQITDMAPEGVKDDQFSINKTRNPFSK